MSDLLTYLLNSIDWGGVLSLIVAGIVIGIVTWRLKIHKDIIDRLKQSDPLSSLIILVLALIGFIAFWLAMRTIGFFVLMKYILTERHRYTPSEIFLMVSYILTANLCFTLLKALSSKGENEDKKPMEGENRNAKSIRGLVDVAIQAVIITFITFLPRNQTEMMGEMGGANAYVIVIISLVISIIGLVFARQRIIKSS